MLFEKNFRNDLEKTKDELASIKKKKCISESMKMCCHSKIISNTLGISKSFQEFFSKGRIIEIYMIILESVHFNGKIGLVWIIWV